jgi:hypothetical protein
VNEDSKPLEKGEIQLFKCLEDAAEYDARQNAMINGVEHLRNVTAFIKLRYKKELDIPNENILYFKTDGYMDFGK